MLSWAMIIKAATMENLIGGFLTMIAFGLGTIPALFFTGVSASLLSVKVRFLGERAAAVSVIVMGLILVYKGAVSI
jgi:sulfite exporter TauE/SafE